METNLKEGKKRLLYENSSVRKTAVIAFCLQHYSFPSSVSLFSHFNGEFKPSESLSSPASLSIILHPIPCRSCYRDVQVTPFIPRENITIDCGSSTGGHQSLDGRVWVGDVDGKFIPIEQPNNKNKSSAVHAESQLPSSVDKVPYSTARLSYSEFTYSMPITAGTKFIRFYFYPISYPGFADPSNKAFFSVKAGLFILLSNFSALLHARGQTTLVNEFFC